MNAGNKKILLPPYIPFKTFLNFISEIQPGSIPSHIDSSVLRKMSGSGRTAMLSALKSLCLINTKLEPTEKFKLLIEAEEIDRLKIITEVVRITYKFVLDSIADIETTSGKLVEEKFKEAGASGSTLNRCIAFFINICKHVNIKISPYIHVPKLQSIGGSKKIKAKPISEKVVITSSLYTGEANTPPNSSDAYSDMVKITVPLRDMQDAIIFFPQNMDETQIKQAVKMADFILKTYYGLENI